MNKYHEGEKARWINRMINAGWCLWIFVDHAVMWRHADEPTQIGIDESYDLFKQYVNTGGQYIPSPYDDFIEAQ